MKTFDDLTPEQQLENVRKWKVYYQTDRDAANDEIKRLEAINAELLVNLKRARTGYQNLIELKILPHGGWDDEARDYIQLFDDAIAKAEATP